MKRIWKRLKEQGRISKIEFYIAAFVGLASMILITLNILGAFSLNQDVLLCVIVILLDTLITTSLIERFGILSSIHDALTAPSESRAYLTVRDQYNRTHPITDYYKDITEMYIMSVANTSFLKGNGITTLEQAAEKGIKVKLLSIDPELDIAKTYENSRIISAVSIPLSENITAYKNARKRNKKFQKNIEMKVCDIIIPYSLFILKKKDQVITMKLDLLSNFVEYTDRRSIIIPPTDQENIAFFLEQWNLLWNRKENTVIDD